MQPSVDSVALVTGGSSGLGRTLTVELASRGVRVAATARDPAQLGGLDHDPVLKWSDGCDGSRLPAPDDTTSRSGS